MEAGKIYINGIFNNGRILEIPFYQRVYVWEEEQWERFNDDMETVTIEKIPFFLGSIILKTSKHPLAWENVPEVKTVIDGQQRLTTLVIFMKVLCLKIGHDDYFCRDFILEDGKTIALQLGLYDSDAFKEIVFKTNLNPVPINEHSSQIYKAFNYFIENIDPAKVNRNIIKQNIQFVCIELTENEDEQQIFDTINSLGVKLTTAELLKNYFFDRYNKPLYNEKWVSVFEKDEETKAYWDMEIESGRIKRSLIDLFFDAYFQIFVQDKSYAVSSEDKISYEKVGSLFKSYKHFVKKYCNDDINVILNPLKEYAECFRKCFNPNICNGVVGSDYGIERMNVIIFGLKTTTVIPYLLYVFKNISTQTKQNEICRVLETYIMRRMITHTTTKNYNKLFTSLILNNVLDAQTLSARLKSGSDETSYIPNDSDVRDSFHKAKLYNLQTRGILYLLESGIHPKQSATALLGFNGYSLEHLMPKKWKNNWTGCQTDEQIEERNAIILTLGNLSIITQSLNASIRDSAWDIKKQGNHNKPGLIACASGIVTLQNALHTEQWNEEEIYKRADYLCDKAVLLWKT